MISKAIKSADNCPLDWPQQRRNLILFAACTGMQYLAAPVLYVGITQASLCEKLGTSTRVANLPATMFFAMTAMPALLAWLSPSVASLRRNLSLCYAATALILGITAATLLADVSNAVKVTMIVIQGGVSGAAIPTAIALLWETIGRGSDESRRGLALGLAFGAGPLLAVLGSFGQTALLGGNFFGVELPGIAYPSGFVILFAAGAPVMALAALVSWMFVIPSPNSEPPREPASSVSGLLLGLPLMVAAIALVQAADMTAKPDQPQNSLRYAGYLAAGAATAALLYHFRPVLTQRVLLLATVVTVLVYSGNMIPSNMNLYSEEVLERSPAEYAGLQNTLRFGFKMIAGALLGWMLTRTSPRAGLLATSLIFLAAQVWAIFATGTWYLVAFGIYGAGELVGVYSPNYIMSASRPTEMRRNMAFVTLLMVPAAPMGYLFGSIVDHVTELKWTVDGMTSEALGFRISFTLCAAMLLAGILLTVTMLPRKPSQTE